MSGVRERERKRELKEEEFSWENSFGPCEWEMRNSFMGTGNSSVLLQYAVKGGSVSLS